MNKTRSLPWVIDVLDDGLRIYRRNLRPFILLAALGFVPSAILSSGANVAAVALLGSGWQALIVLLIAPFTYLLTLFTLSALSRLTLQVVQGGEPDLRAATRLRPRRLLGMGCYTAMFTTVAAIVFGAGGFVCLCVGLVPLGGLGMLSLGGSSSFAPLSVLLVGVSGLGYLFAIAALYIAAVYSVQAFALEDQKFSAAMSRSNDLLTYRLGRTVACFLAAGAILTVVVAAYAGVLLGVGALVLRTLNLNPSQPVQAVLFSLVTSASLIFLAPPLPIWMALLFLRLRAERDGGDLEQRIGAWSAGPAAPTSTF